MVIDGHCNCDNRKINHVGMDGTARQTESVCTQSDIRGRPGLRGREQSLGSDGSFLSLRRGIFSKDLMLVDMGHSCCLPSKAYHVDRSRQSENCTVSDRDGRPSSEDTSTPCMRLYGTLHHHPLGTPRRSHLGTAAHSCIAVLPAAIG